MAQGLVETDEAETGHSYGQSLGDIFHQADVFFDIAQEDALEVEVSRFISALFLRNDASPTRDEFGAYSAKSASLRTVDLSRQVGSAIFSPEGDLISLGCNEVPKAGGGHYWTEDKFKARDIERRFETNKIETNKIIVDLFERMSALNLLSDGSSVADLLRDSATREAIDEALVSDITEYGRMTHAEMSAICDAARLGRAVKGATMFVTTFPCHNCAKHIIASGIARVVFIEPYPKSKALKSHGDAIATDSACSSGRVVFEHFQGISPRRYRNIFEKEGKRRQADGTAREWFKGYPFPAVRDLSPMYLLREAAAIEQKIPRQTQEDE